LPSQVQKTFKTPNRLDQIRISPQDNIIKTASPKNRKRILKVVREEKQITCKGKTLNLTVDFSTET
jgi:hypothetical protein